MVKRRKKNGKNAGTLSIIFIVIIFLVVMSIQIYKLKEKDAILKEYEDAKEQELAELLLEAEELEKLKQSTQSLEFIVEMAHKWGLVFENEFIYKESGE